MDMILGEYGFHVSIVLNGFERFAVFELVPDLLMVFDFHENSSFQVSSNAN